MLPFEIPADATLESLLLSVYPEAHGRLVPQSAGREPFTAAVEIGARAWLATLDGTKMTVEERDEKKCDLRIMTERAAAEAFVDDLTGDKRFVPRFAPPSDIALFTDPRILKRVKMANGTIELAISDFPLDGEATRVAMKIAVGAPARRVDPDPDVTIETTIATVERILDGQLGPEEALADGGVNVSGKKLVAGQLAFALAPLFPKL